MKKTEKTLNMAISYIIDHMNTDCIFCFGNRKNNWSAFSTFSNSITIKNEPKKSIHYDFLVVTKGKCDNHPDLTVKLENILDIELSITIVTHSITAVKKQLKDNNRFFHTVIGSTEPIYSPTGNLPAGLIRSLTKYPFNQQADTIKTLDFCKAAYRKIYACSGIVYESGWPEVYVPLINRGIKEVCLLLIGAMIGYQPKDYTLEELLTFCDSIDPRFRNLIPLVTEDNIYHYELILKGYWKGKYGRDKEPILEYLSKYLDDLNDLAVELCESRLGSIEDL